MDVQPIRKQARNWIYINQSEHKIPASTDARLLCIHFTFKMETARSSKTLSVTWCHHSRIRTSATKNVKIMDEGTATVKKVTTGILTGVPPMYKLAYLI
jgi:hypothetical protein